MKKTPFKDQIIPVKTRLYNQPNKHLANKCFSLILIDKSWPANLKKL